MANPSNDVAALLASITASLQNTGPAPAPLPVATPSPYPSAPVPSASGTIDLSQIKPSSSGTLAMSVPNPYGRDDRYARDPYANPYLARRDYDDYGRERSRDRERDRYPPPPPVRYDDPYDRDPRRMPDARDRGHYARDRSYSPSRRAPMALPDTGDRQTDPMMIDQGYVGLVIGKGGDTLRRVENNSGAKVQFMPESHTKAGERLCNLIGTRRQTDLARRLIDEIIAENIALKGPLPNAKHNLPKNLTAPVPVYDMARPVVQQEVETPDRVVQIMVPDKTVGLIIGRGGENIKDLQARSHAKINIVPENQSINGQRPINLLGDAQQTARAKELIFQIVADDEAGIPISRKPPPESIGVGSRQEIVRVPQDSVGMIIGKGGDNVRDMQTTSNCSIKVSSQSDAEMREITLTGTDETIARAKQLIDDKVQQAAAKHGRGVYGAGGSSQVPAVSHDPYAAWGQQYAQAPAGGSAAAAPVPDYSQFGGHDAYVELWRQYHQNLAGAAPQ